MITSVQNNRVKQWKKLHTRKERMNTNTFLIEGDHLLEEALRSGWKIKEVILEEGENDLQLETNNLQTTIVSKTVFRHLSQTQSPQGIMAVVYMKESLNIKGEQILIVDRVQDPGNLGTMIRTADAAGFSGIILGEGTVDLYNDKVIRATQGSIFHLPIIQANLVDEINQLKQNGFTILATALEDAVRYDQICIQERTAIVVGNEGAGIQEKILNQADHIVSIPIYGQAESLNVSIAAAILMYHVKSKKT